MKAAKPPEFLPPMPGDQASAVEPPSRYPATIALCLAWVLIYFAMAWHQGSLHANPSSWLAGGIRPQTAYQFGALTTTDVAKGELWRTLTASMLHFSLIHLAINTWVLFQLGRMIEPWYGSALFLTIYVVMAVLSNVAAAALRPLTGQSLLLQSGGGSGVICGLIALIGIVGWRSRSRFGSYMLRQMAFQLVLIALMGWLIPNIDNLVHASGAAAGVLVGLADPWLIERADRPLARCLGVVALGLLVGAGAAQIADQQAEASRQRELIVKAAQLDTRRRVMFAVSSAVRDLATLGGPGEPATQPGREAARRNLANLFAGLGSETSANQSPIAESDPATIVERIARSALKATAPPGPDPPLS